jgi:phage gpG-like protein
MHWGRMLDFAELSVVRVKALADRATGARPLLAHSVADRMRVNSSESFVFEGTPEERSRRGRMRA